MLKTKLINKKFLITLMLFNLLLFSSLCFGATYYVDATNGNNNNNGLSILFPWQNIAKVNNSQFLPGDNILLKRGEIWRETLVVTSSGAPGQSITYGAYGSGNKPEISGDEFCIHSDKSVDHIRIDGLSLRNAKVSAIISDDNDGWVISNCDFTQNYQHIFAGDLDGSQTITGFEIFNCKFLTTTARKGGDWNYSSVRLRFMMKPTVHHNFFDTDNADQALLYEWGSYGRIYQNEFVNCAGAIAFCHHINGQIYRNHAHDGTGYGIAIQYESHYAEIYYNLIHDLVVESSHGDYNGIDINTNSDNGKCYNNTVRAVPRACLTIEYYPPGAADGWEVKNNILDATDNHNTVGPIMIYSEVSRIILSNNLYIPGSNGKVGKLGNVYYSTYSDWEHAVNNKNSHSEKNSFVLNPRFTNPENDDFSLQSGSPAIDSGTNVELMQDFIGNLVPAGIAPDIGALEYNLNSGTNIPPRPMSLVIIEFKE